MVFFFNDPATTEIYTYFHTLSLHAALPISAYPERAVYCAAGEIEIGSAVLGAGQMAVLNGRDAADVAANQPSTVMVLGGEPIGERFLLWNRSEEHTFELQ